MKLLIIVETPDDDGLHFPRQTAALQEYGERVHANNFRKLGAEPYTAIGMDGGPNTMLCSNGVKVTEQRIDADYFKGKVYDALPRWARGIWGRLVWA